jgi:hypothetical protein
MYKKKRTLINQFKSRRRKWINLENEVYQVKRGQKVSKLHQKDLMIKFNRILMIKIMAWILLSPTR